MNTSKYLLPVCTLLAAAVSAATVLSFFTGVALGTLAAFGIVATPT